ncbi:SRPBCC family protein [Micromonospora sp. R77]|uniref:SRPBCC family protein n=1 Tax=Micromonospora sp. R77 TaxID=2925836 RepID=UPI001F603924|nr:SRPBCC family protein [Micromonospora sp. R77]MCI4066764.1 SRPBCC family protein [Micromonospora sp. R77]
MTAPGWPRGLEPERTPVHVRNEAWVPLPPEAVWARLVDAVAWPSWYANAHRVVVVDAAALGPGVRFRWTTLHVRVSCVVDRWEPGRLLGWTGRALGSSGHHRWVLTPLDGGTRVVTEETQAGPVPRLAGRWLTRSLLRWHQRWLDGIAPSR